ncbi:glycosyl transferase [Tsuneonella deserti]|uniref:Glycosyl transferase n=1 Tax=Tsuneonella deserti TaxID=2035528 RepID=A0ABQ1SAG4_9SPHN|nr:sugar transferase [Tsuneonella deserti]GGE03169.1 glycosyl transferase [Tsuneonella deserti]
MTRYQEILKRAFDVVVSGLAILPAAPVIAACALAARRDTGASGIFSQQRVGRGGRLFTVYKIRTMRAVGGPTVTTAGDARITPLGAKMRRWKLDELPQLWNVLKGDMSLVGPRPDVPGFADRLTGEERDMLRLRPGITGPATLKYRDEETLLAGQADPERYNAEAVWPDKVAINLAYMNDWSLGRDIALIWRTVAGS